VVELADAEDLKSSDFGHVGSSPTAPTSFFLPFCHILPAGMQLFNA